MATNPNELFGSKVPVTAITQVEGQKPYYVDANGTVKDLTPNLIRYWIYSLTGVLYDADKDLPKGDGTPFRTLNGIFKIVNGIPVRMMITDFSSLQIELMPLYLPPTVELIAKTLRAGIAELGQ